MDKRLYDYELDENVDLFLLIKNADERVAKNNKKFIAFTFQDKSGQMDAMYWDASEEDIESFQSGRVVRVKGKRELYQNRAQLKIFSMHLAEESDPINPELYIETAPLSKEEMMEEINETLDLITNSNIHAIVRYLLNKHHKEYFTAPAAKRLHHAYAGGLAYHTISMLQLAKVIVDQYDSVNPSLLYGGLILHDLGKIKELSGPISTDYTLEGNLVGHIVIIAEEISKACQELDIDEQDEDVLLLKHMVLSHHGQLEFGSPVRPRLLEAEILSAIDDLDASIFMIEDAVSRSEPGEYTERIFGLENRSFYVPSKNISHGLEEDSEE